MNELSAVAVTSTAIDPLADVGIAITLDGFLATTRVTQTFRNVEAEAIEAVFTFPVPYGAVLTGVEADLAGKTVTSVAMPKRQAANRYEDAVSTGDSAILVEEVSPGLHCVNLGNLAPGESATLRFTFGQWLDWRDDRLSLRIPTSIAPRYGRPAMTTHAVPETVLDLIRATSLKIVGNQGVGRWSVVSPTHPMTVRAEGGDLVIEPDGGRLTMDRDIVVDFLGRFEPTSVVAKDGDGFLAAVTFQPEAEPRQIGRERVLKILIDCSGSMNGVSIRQAGKAVGAILRTLRPEDLFSVTRFGSQVVQETGGLVQASQEAVRKALSWAENMQADLGGTELRMALLETFALEVPRSHSSGADILLITDGQSWDDQGILAAARASRHRLFTIGVGTASAEHLLRSLSESSGGSCEIVTPREGMAERVVRQVLRMDGRRLSGQVQWPAGAKSICSGQLGPIFAGDTIHTVAWFDSLPQGNCVLTLHDGEQEIGHQAVSLDRKIEGADAGVLRGVAAHTLIGDTVDAAKAGELAVRYGLLTAHTHLLLVAERDEKLDGQPALRKVPQLLAAGWSGTGSIEERQSLTLHSASFVHACARSDESSLDLPAFLRRGGSDPVRRQGRFYERMIGFQGYPGGSQPDWLHSFGQAVNGESSDISGLDLQWLRQAGVPDGLCNQLNAFVQGKFGARDVALCFLYLAVSETGEGVFDRGASRLVRRAFMELLASAPVEVDQLMDAIRAILKAPLDWKAFTGS